MLGRDSFGLVNSEQRASERAIYHGFLACCRLLLLLVLSVSLIMLHFVSPEYWLSRASSPALMPRQSGKQR